MDFNDIYRLTYPSGSRVIALGVQETKGHSGISYLVPGGLARRYKGKVTKDTGDLLEVATDTGTLRFEHLNLSRFMEMSSEIQGFNAISKQLSSDFALHLFYRENFLPDYWVEDFENGIRHDPPAGG